MGSCYHSSDEVLFFCPKCKHHKKKLSVNLEKNKFQCWVCGFRGNNVRRLIRRFGSFTDQQEWAKFDDSVEIASFEEAFSMQQEPEENILQKIDLPEEFKTLCSDSLSLASKPILRFLYERGVSDMDILKWKIGYCPSGEYKERVIIPSFDDDGDVNYFVARTYRSSWKKYTNPPARKNLVFNELYVDWEEPLSLVEGIFDAVVAGNSVPILGSSLRGDSELFKEIVKHDTPVYIALDVDAEKKAMNLIKKLLTYDVELYKVDIKPYSDVGEMTREEYNKRKMSAQLMDSQSYFSESIAAI